jgi:hypothetical protein
MDRDLASGHLSSRYDCLVTHVLLDNRILRINICNTCHTPVICVILYNYAVLNFYLLAHLFNPHNGVVNTHLEGRHIKLERERV